MNVRELMELLEGLNPDAEVRVATQQNYPLQSSLYGVTTSEDMDADRECEDHGHYNCDECEGTVAENYGDGEPLVWLVEGLQDLHHPYAPRGLWDAAQRAY